MLKGSFWYPKTGQRALLLLVILVMIPIQQSELFGLMSTPTLLFGWLPLQLAYDVGYMFAGVAVLLVMYRMAPEPPAEYEPLRDQKNREKQSGKGE